MHTIPIVEGMKQLPVAEVEASLTDFLRPIRERLPDKRLGRVVSLSVQGILGSELGQSGEQLNQNFKRLFLGNH